MLLIDFGDLLLQMLALPRVTDKQLGFFQNWETNSEAGLFTQLAGCGAHGEGPAMAVSSVGAAVVKPSIGRFRPTHWTVDDNETMR